ncbi:cytochrome P450 4C1-like [Helicoverpa zea]|uniref:cytochrome P450 4C1-like n=1 Tax=Helicoverpa zea TaxID=7113 RepID=UPI001F571571|nr:cytochrome P450 4C1-like [Helicoverpa zea]XP_047029055.1 cytochrome P450 4C1-like [Helicoverpa zea]
MLLSLALVGFITFILWRLLSEEDNPLDKLPGPKKLPIVGSAFEFMRMNPRDLFIKIRLFAEIYGDRYLIKILGRRILHVHNVKDVEVVLAHSRNIKKSKPYTFLESWLGTGLLLSNGAKWHKRRKILTPTFHFNILKSFSIVMKERSKGLVEKIKTLENTDVNLLPLISDYTLYIICETAMGTQLDSDKSAKTQEYKSAILSIGNLLFARLTRVWLHNEYFFKMHSLGRRFQKCLEKVHSFADDVIMERKKNWKPGQSEFTEEDSVGGKKRLAMLDLLLEAESKGEIDLEGIREEVNTFMFEGHDTTAMAIVLGLMLIADHEEVQDRIFEECQKIFPDAESTPSMSDLADMKYLEAVIKETLRLYPSVPFIARAITEDFMLDDLLVKKGSEVSIHIYDLHRRADLFPDPEAFKPERFLSGEPMHPYAFVPFSAGPRNCIGQRFAMLEMKCVLSGICRNFKLQPRVKGARPALLADMLIRPAEPVYVKFIRR